MNIYLGSAEAVGLMCLQVFCQGNKQLYDDLKDYAMRLGAAFQKINFLRDLQADFIGMGRNYFPGLQLERFDDNSKKKIEESIKNDLEEGFKGIKKLPRSSRFGVYVAYVYYLALFNKIRNTPSEMILNSKNQYTKKTKGNIARIFLCEASIKPYLMEEIILVDEQDNAIGTMEKMEAHRRGVLHRAFSVVLFNSSGDLLLQRRAENKYHSGGLWTNTCCSHPLPDESIRDAAQRRLKYEMGINLKPEFAFKFIYKTPLDKRPDRARA